jgi:hypothetical protein
LASPQRITSAECNASSCGPGATPRDGYVVRGEDDEQLVELGREHMQANHPAIAAVITAEELLEMAEQE